MKKVYIECLKKTVDLNEKQMLITSVYLVYGELERSGKLKRTETLLMLF